MVMMITMIWGMHTRFATGSFVPHSGFYSPTNVLGRIALADADTGIPTFRRTQSRRRDWHCSRRRGPRRHPHCRLRVLLLPPRP